MAESYDFIPRSALQPLPSQNAMRYQRRALDADSRIAETWKNQPRPAEINQRTRAMKEAQLREYQSRLDAADRSIQNTRNQPQLQPREINQRTQASQAAQLAQYKARLDAADRSIQATGIKQRPFTAQAQQIPSGINQPANKLPGPTSVPPLRPTPPAPPRPTAGPSRIPAGVAATAATAATTGGKVVEALGGPVGVAVTFGPVIHDGLGAAFDAQFPQLAPYHQALENVTALAGSNPFGMGVIQNHPLNPLNPFGRWWDWAPWNKPKNPNSLKPGLTAEDHDFPPDQAEQAVPFDLPPGTPPALFKLSLTGQIDNYGQTYSDFINHIPVHKINDFQINEERNIFGVPEMLLIQPAGNAGFSVALKVRGEPAYTYFSYPATAPTETTGGQLVASKSLHISDFPWPRKRDFDIPPSETVPARPDEPDAPPQYQPAGYPELPIPSHPYPSPKPLPNLRPSTGTNLRPSPFRDPATQPPLFPTPDPNPTAPPLPDTNPGESPLPFFQPTPNPGPLFKPDTGFAPSGNTGYSNAPGATPKNLEVPDGLIDELIQQQPAPEPESKPAPDADLCKDPCIADMHNTSQGQKPKQISYKAFKKCGDNGPEFETKTMSVPSAEADALKILLDDAADRKGEKCSTAAAATLTTPEWWAVRPGADRPQFVVLYAEVFGSGKLGDGRWQMTIPHYNRPKGAKPQLPKYRKGSWRGTLTLTDNSKIVINAATASEAKKVINKLKILIPVDKRTVNGNAIKPTILERPDGTLKEANVIPIRGDFYATGQRKNAPDWSVNFR